MMSRLMINRTRTSHLLILSLLSSFFPPPLLCGWKHVIIFTPSPPWRTNIDICLFHLEKNSGLFIENRGWKKEKKAGLFFPPSSSCSDHSHVPLEWFCWWRSSLEEPAQTGRTRVLCLLTRSNIADFFHFLFIRSQQSGKTGSVNGILENSFTELVAFDHKKQFWCRRIKVWAERGLHLLIILFYF